MRSNDLSPDPGCGGALWAAPRALAAAPGPPRGTTTSEIAYHGGKVKRWRDAETAPRWAATGLMEAKKTFRCLKAYRQLPILRKALQGRAKKSQSNCALETVKKAA